MKAASSRRAGIQRLFPGRRRRDPAFLRQRVSELLGDDVEAWAWYAAMRDRHDDVVLAEAAAVLAARLRALRGAGTSGP